MAKRGRPVKGAELVDGRIDTLSAEAKQRLRLILQTLAGAITINEACQVLGIGRSRFHTLRQEFLARAGAVLEPRPRGRRRRQVTPADLEIQRLKHEMAQLKLDLRATQIREEIALVMPHLLSKKPERAPGKKTPRIRRKGTRGGSTRLRK